MKTLLQTLQQAERDAVAIGHFNISDLVGLKAAFDLARELNVPVIVLTSRRRARVYGRDEDSFFPLVGPRTSSKERTINCRGLI